MLRTFRSTVNSVVQSQAEKMVRTLPFADTKVKSPGFGAMGISAFMGTNLSLEQAEPVLLKAIELGCTFWDTAVSFQGCLSKKLCEKKGRERANMIGWRLSTKQESMKGFLAISSESTMSGIRFSVSTKYLSWKHHVTDTCSQSPPSADSTFSEGMGASPTQQRISTSTLKAQLKDSALHQTCTIYTGWIPVC